MKQLFDINRCNVSFAEYLDYCKENGITPTDDGYYGYCSNLTAVEYEIALCRLYKVFPGKVNAEGVVVNGKQSKEITRQYDDIESAINGCESLGEELYSIKLDPDGSAFVEVIRGRHVIGFVLTPVEFCRGELTPAE